MQKKQKQIKALIKQLLTKYQIFTNIAKNKFQTFSNKMKNVIFQVFLQKLFRSDNCIHPYKFHGRDMSGHTLTFIFASCHPLSILFEMMILR